MFWLLSVMVMTGMVGRVEWGSKRLEGGAEVVGRTCLVKIGWGQGV